jgi:hypothetical protein
VLIKALNLGSEIERGFLTRVGALRDFLKHDYRRMCVNALSTPATRGSVQCMAVHPVRFEHPHRW